DRFDGVVTGQASADGADGVLRCVEEHRRLEIVVLTKADRAHNGQFGDAVSASDLHRFAKLNLEALERVDVDGGFICRLRCASFDEGGAINVRVAGPVVDE